ncbi:chorismate mutase [Candidatus Peregrinibacteria bacterium]|nr:chorismate mutase [Candidatus Peregrinibacteria bacterium]
MDLETLRKKINRLDVQLLQTLKDRFKTAEEIATLKGEHVYDPKREHELLQQWLSQGLDENFTRALFHMILNESRSLMIKK